MCRSSGTEVSDPNAMDARTGGKVGRTRVWGHSALRLQRGGAPGSCVNRFTADIAMAWALPIMHHFDVKGTHG